MNIRRQRTEDRGQRFVCRTAALFEHECGEAATTRQSSVLSPLSSERGFTLVEMIVVMVITGIIGGMVAIFIKAPVQGYVDSARRAELTDIADTALRRLARDIRTAVPNSVRVTTANCTAAGAANCYVEFLPTKNGGRYRAIDAGGTGGCGAAGDDLSFTAADSCFEIVGSPITVAAGDQVIVGSTQSNGNPPYQNPALAACGVAATTTCIRRAIAVAGVNTQVIQTTSLYPLPDFSQLEEQRFSVVDGVEKAVTYGCLNVGTVAGEGTGTLTRYWSYNFNAAQTNPPGGTTAILADRVSACEISYDTFNQRNGLVVMRLGITRGNETASLYHTIHVNNVP